MTTREIVRFGEGFSRRQTDVVTLEEPLSIRVSGQHFATTMRTPGHDFELGLGLLFAEGIIQSATDVASSARWGHPESTDYGNVINIVLRTAASVRALHTRNSATPATSSCGVCARGGIEELVERCSPVRGSLAWTAHEVAMLPELLRAEQRRFDLTGAEHAAAIVTRTGHILCAREDLGRHNAVDKVVGRLLLDGLLPATDHALVVSGRASFELVQKAAAAGVSLVVSVSAPSSLAIEMAERYDVTLIGFARGPLFNVYTRADRIV